MACNRRTEGEKTMRKTMRHFILALAMAALPTVTRAQTITFYDTMSGANFVQWWQAYAVPACKAETKADIRYASTGSPEVLQRIKAAGSGSGDIDLLFLAPDKIAAFHGEGVLEDLTAYASLIPNLTKTEAPDKDKAA